MSEQDQGVTPSGPGCQPSASAADASSQSGIPNAGSFHGYTRDLDGDRTVEFGRFTGDDGVERWGLGFRTGETWTRLALSDDAFATMIDLHRKYERWLKWDRSATKTLRYVVRFVMDTTTGSRSAAEWVAADPNASAMSAEGQDRNGLGAKPASAVGEAETPNLTTDPTPVQEMDR